jgi:hypothetical protein
MWSNPTRLSIWSLDPKNKSNSLSGWMDVVLSVADGLKVDGFVPFAEEDDVGGTSRIAKDRRGSPPNFPWPELWDPWLDEAKTADLRKTDDELLELASFCPVTFAMSHDRKVYILWTSKLI